MYCKSIFFYNSPPVFTLQILPGMKSAFSEILLTYYRHNSLNQTVNKDIMATIVTATIAEMTNELKKASAICC